MTSILMSLRWWYCRCWVWDGRWLNLRDKIMHLVVITNLQYNLLLLFPHFGWSYIWVLAIVFNAALIKEIYDYFVKTRFLKHREVSGVVEEFASDVQIDSIYDMIYDLTGMLIGWTLYYNLREELTQVSILIICLIAYMLNKIHFKPDGSQALWGNKLFLLDDFPLFSSKVEGVAALLDEWQIERMRDFHRRMIQSESEDKTE